MNQTTLDRAHSEFRVFLTLLWKHLNLPKPTPAQLAFADYLQWGPDRQMIMAFRGCGKSWISAGYALWKLFNDPDEKILVLSASSDRARAFTTFVLRIIDEWVLLQHLKPGSGDRKSTEAFDVGACRAAQSPSVKAAGIFGQVTGSRATTIIFDDVETPNTAETVGMRQKLEERVAEAAAIIVPEGDTKILYLGTPQTAQTLYAKLPSKGYDVQIWPSRAPDTDTLAGYESIGATIFPELRKRMDDGELLVDDPTDTRFSDSDLSEREREYGKSGFKLQFQLDPSVSDADRYPLRLRDLTIGTFDAETVPNKVVWSGDPGNKAEDLPSLGIGKDCYQRRMVIKDPDGQERGGYSELSKGLLTIDPSGRGKDETAWNVTKVLNGQIFLVAQGGFRGDGYSEEVLEKLARLYVTHNCNRVWIESNYGDGMFSRLASPIFKKITGRGITDQDEFKVKGQKETRIVSTLEPIMNQHKLIVDESVVGDDYTSVPLDDPRRQERMLFYQMSHITRDRGSLRFDDRIDCLASACAAWLDHLGKDVDAEVERRSDEALLNEARKWRQSMGIKERGKGFLAKINRTIR